MKEQYNRIKAQYPDCLLFFRLGDFYELFDDDARLAAQLLELALTSRDKGPNATPMCGVPYHAADTYLDRLTSLGYRVAICEQVEDPRQTKGLVRREVVRVVSPGTNTLSRSLPAKEPRLVACVAAQQGRWGIAHCDVSTGLFQVTEVPNLEQALEELNRLNPAECLLPPTLENDLARRGLNGLYCLNQKAFDQAEAYRLLTGHLKTTTLEPFDCEGKPGAVAAAGALLSYLLDTQKNSLAHLTRLNYYDISACLVLDAATRRNLELVRGNFSGQKSDSLLGVLDLTETAMGGRLLAAWVQQPLVDQAQIEARLDAVEALAGDIFLRTDLRQRLKGIYDLERILGRVAYGSANPRDLLALAGSLALVAELKELLAPHAGSLLKTLAQELNPESELQQELTRALEPEAPASPTEGGVIARGYNPEADRLRDARLNGRRWIAELEAEEKQKTGIKSLKVGYNKVFGYYLEVSKANLSLVPAYFIRKQTLANGERYVTPRLTELEEQVLGAEEKLNALEYQLFTDLRRRVADKIEALQKTSRAVAAVDALLSLAEAAVRYNYVKPQITARTVLKIEGARHPVVEKNAPGEFVPNDLFLEAPDRVLGILTGPNMAGKSTYIRTAALITIMAQIGGFVPARSAEIGLTDRIFARIGASDNLAAGQSTFMVEMQEVAKILHQATPQSLVILDEVGRGTSTFDGLSIARAVCEDLLTRTRCRSLFATHYHQLTAIPGDFPGAFNCSMAVKEAGQEIVFLRQVVPCPADKSYGIQVARLAGVPLRVTARAEELLKAMENLPAAETAAAAEATELPGAWPEIIDELFSLNLEELTPLKALNLLSAWQERLQKGRGEAL